MKTAYFAGGCFWCITPDFRDMKGVQSVKSGYAGGDEKDPTYQEVKKQLTGHRETICVDYDETVVTFEELLDLFISHVDPFDEGGQFIDRGFSYTLAVYTNNAEEETITREKIRALEERSGKTVFIAVEPAKTFYLAEEYHQDYDLKNPEAFQKELEESGRAEIFRLN